jgi:ataxin-3
MDVGGDDSDQEYFVTPPSASTRLPPARAAGSGDRNYDDEDAELQAALKASLEGHTAGGAGLAVPSEPRVPEAKPAEEEDEEEEPTQAPSSPEVETKAEVADPDEIRRRRLARFGG